MRPQTIFIILMSVLVLTQINSYAGVLEKDHYSEDAIYIDGKSYRVMVDPEAEKVARFWDDETGGWKDASQCSVDLNRAYEDKVTMQDQQNEMNEMREESWDDRYHGDMMGH